MNRSNMPGAFSRKILFHTISQIQKHDSNLIFFEVHGNSPYPIFKFDQFAGSYIIQPEYIGYAISHLQYGSNFFKFSFQINVIQLLLKNI